METCELTLLITKQQQQNYIQSGENTIYCGLGSSDSVGQDSLSLAVQPSVMLSIKIWDHTCPNVEHLYTVEILSIIFN